MTIFWPEKSFREIGGKSRGGKSFKKIAPGGARGDPGGVSSGSGSRAAGQQGAKKPPRVGRWYEISPPGGGWVLYCSVPIRREIPFKAAQNIINVYIGLIDAVAIAQRG